MNKKSWTLTIKNQPLTLTLTPPPSWGYCYKCEIEKPIRIISEHSFWTCTEVRKFCQPCALESLNKLEKGDYEVKPQVIQELRSSLIHV